MYLCINASAASAYGLIFVDFVSDDVLKVAQALVVVTSLTYEKHLYCIIVF